MFNASAKACTFHGGCSIQMFYNKPPIGNLISNIHTDVYIRTEIDSLIATISISNYYNKTEIDDIDNELSISILNTYNKNAINTFFTDYYNIEYPTTQFDLKANNLDT